VPTVQPSALPAGFSASWLPATLSASWLRAGVSASWLRASCPCPACLDPGSGQRLASITDQPADTRLGEVIEDADSLVVTYEPDGHLAVIAKVRLAQALAAAWRVLAR